MEKKIENYDVLILGAGPSGMTAAIYSSRYHLKTIVVGKNFGGTANLAGEIENWPGFVGSGVELMEKIKKQAESFGAIFCQAELTKLKKDERGFFVELDDKIVYGKSVIVALGTEHRKLNIKGEKEFVGKGVSFCTTCDGAFFKDKIVAIIGGADSAAKAAMYLAGIAKKVYVVYRKNEMRCEPISLKKLKQTQNIEFILNAVPLEIFGNKKVDGLKVLQDEKEKIISLNGVFIEIGATPILEVLSELKLEIDKEGYIVTDKNTKTNVAGVFASGDSTNNNFKQIVVAAGEGAKAAKAVFEYLKNH